MQQLNLTDEELAKLAALNDGDELAPPPSNNELFGEQLEALENEYQTDMERYEKTLAENQNKVQADLQSKLAARRQRRARKNIEEKEKSAMS